ncbi:hypothetical protein L1987_27692 [Smallanthus sonchifolius]|uniref:Uncharacterized protein n=1 Tax=Smallanthus sonchifolius TaxID=185202 RepID=A0ACB9IC13_9ASTR|nr:hypothetical protein L1987_27692 [Smallanthus sonchifolius]
MLVELSRRKRDANMNPDPNLDIFMKNSVIKRSPIWDAIINFKPHVFIWLEDNVHEHIRGDIAASIHLSQVRFGDGNSSEESAEGRYVPNAGFLEDVFEDPSLLTTSQQSDIDASLDIKKSSHKKLSKWLQSKSSEGLISSKEDKHKKEVMVLAINRKHPDYTSFKPEKQQVEKKEQTIEPVNETDINGIMEGIEIYKPSVPCKSNFHIMHLMFVNSRELPPLGVPLDHVLATLICRSEKNDFHYGALQDGIYQLQKSQDLVERTAAGVDHIRGDLQITDAVHNNLVDLVLEMKNEIFDLTRRAEVTKKSATEVEETIAAMMIGSSDACVSAFH